MFAAKQLTDGDFNVAYEVFAWFIALAEDRGWSTPTPLRLYWMSIKLDCLCPVDVVRRGEGIEYAVT